jgi:aspartate/methionine/tyrosine aminotransferase
VNSATIRVSYFRIAFTLPDDRLAEAMRRIERFHG